MREERRGEETDERTATEREREREREGKKSKRQRETEREQKRERERERESAGKQERRDRAWLGDSSGAGGLQTTRVVLHAASLQLLIRARISKLGRHTLASQLHGARPRTGTAEDCTQALHKIHLLEPEKKGGRNNHAA